MLHLIVLIKMKRAFGLIQAAFKSFMEEQAKGSKMSYKGLCYLNSQCVLTTMYKLYNAKSKMNKLQGALNDHPTKHELK